MHEAEETITRLLEEIIALRQQVASLQVFAAERARAEIALRQAKEAAETSEREKSEFIATLSHELRTPLSVIFGYVELLLEEGFGAIPIQQGEVLERIRQNSSQLLELISGVLDLSRIEARRLPVEFSQVGVSDLLKTVEQETLGLQSQSKLDFVWRINEELPPVCTDPAKLKVIIKNLIGNAVKFTKAGRITVETQPHAGGVEIRVADTGIGIARESLPVIFEPFQQLNVVGGQGTGLGLHIVKRLLTLLGGSITVESEVGRGSTFCVWVPVTNQTSISVGAKAKTSAEGNERNP